MLTPATVRSTSASSCATASAAAAAPVIERYLAPCPTTAAQYTTPGIDGSAYAGQDGGLFMQTCLLAWDPTTKTVASGLTIECVGDWECPAGSLCDRVPYTG